MARLVAAITFGLFFLTGGIAAAQAAWVQVEAQPTLTQAETRVRAYAQDFPNVNGFRLRSGWYAIAIGPFQAPEAAERLRALRAERLIPGDSFIADGTSFVQQFWPVGGALLAPDPVPQPAPDLSVTVTPLPDPGTAAPPAPEPEPPVDLTPPDETAAEARRSEALLTRDERQMLQTALAWDGVYTSGIDGAFGPGTRAAMAAWQAARGYEPTGVLTTRQRDELVGGYRAVLAGLGLAPVRDNTAGIEVEMPTALVAKGDYQPPFAHYNAKGDSGVRVILISQEGDADTLFGLYDILQTLEIMPLDGPRQRRERSFVIEGANAAFVSHAEAELTENGNVKGFVLIWPRGDERRREMVLTAMQSSFRPIPDAVLPDTAGDGEGQSIDLLAGLEIRRPDATRTGFYIDAAGHVLTAADAVGACGRITLDDEIEADVLASDAALGVAVLRAREPLAPIGYARFQPGIPRLQSEIAVSGYSYDGRLGAPVLTFGTFADLTGLNGEDGLSRLALAATPGDAGGPVFDGSGAVVGMLLPPADGSGRVLPEDVSFAADAPEIAAFLSDHGLAATAAEPAGDIAPEDLTRLARDMTVLVSCWN